MSDSSQHVLVKVNDQEFIVEIEDISASPVIAKIEGQSYEVVIGDPIEFPQIKAIKRVSIPPASAVSLKSESTPAITSVENAVTAPMPGDIIEVNVRPGQHIGVGDELCVLEAMKMKNVIYASREGAIASVEVSEGQSVDYGAVLVTFE